MLEKENGVSLVIYMFDDTPDVMSHLPCSPLTSPEITVGESVFQVLL
jgi:hypothetical protein